ncbi:HD-GYP domain-containing protein [Endothiovibrio diazotrophicus]
MRKVKEDEVLVGRPLLWAVYDAGGVMLAPEGKVFEDPEELEAFRVRGLYTLGETREQRIARLKSDKEQADERAHVAVFDKVAALPARLNQINRTLLDDAGEDVTMRVVRLAEEIQVLCAEDSDAVLAALHVRYDEALGVVETLHAAALCELLAAAKGLNKAQRLPILCGALTHDVGFTRLASSLHRQTSPLTDAQWADVREHPLKSEALLRNGGVTNEVWLDVVRHHHERLDGGGYPDKLAGEAISLPTRILAIADIYAAMIKPRGYREAILGKDAVREIFLERGASVDEELTQLFVRRIGIFPPGAFVKLRNEEIGVVIRQSDNAAHPRICSVLSPRGVPLPRPQFRDTADKSFSVVEMVPHQRYRSILGMLHVLWRNA